MGEKRRFVETEKALGAKNENISVTQATAAAIVALRFAIDQGAALAESTLAARSDAWATATEAIPFASGDNLFCELPFD